MSESETNTQTEDTNQADDTNQTALVINDRQYMLSDLNEQQRRMVEMYTEFKKESVKLRMEVSKNELACEALGQRLSASLDKIDADGEVETETE